MQVYTTQAIDAGPRQWQGVHSEPSAPFWGQLSPAKCDNTLVRRSHGHASLSASNTHRSFMATKKSGPLHRLLAAKLILPGKGKLQVRYARRDLLTEDKMADITESGNIVYEGQELRTIAQLCQMVIGRNVPQLQKRVRYGNNNLSELFKKVAKEPPQLQISPPPMAPTSPPPAYSQWRDMVAEYLQLRLSPDMSAVVKDELTFDVHDSVAAFFLRDVPVDIRSSKIRSRRQFPVGTFPCYRYLLFSTAAIVKLFEGTSVPFTLRKYFATAVGSSALVQLDGPLPPPTTEELLELAHSGGHLRRPYYLHWLACDVQSPNARVTQHHGLKIVWYPSLLPHTGTGKITFRFNYVHVDNGCRSYGELPVKPSKPLEGDDSIRTCPLWGVRLNTSEEKPLVLKFVKLS